MTNSEWAYIMSQKLEAQAISVCEKMHDFKEDEAKAKYLKLRETIKELDKLFGYEAE